MKPLVLVLAALLLAFAAPLWADDHAAEVERPDDTRVITETEATSECIGDPRTPVCAVETLLACWVRKKDSLCKAVTTTETGLDSGLFSISYRVLLSAIIRNVDIPQHLTISYWIKPGYAEVEIEEITINNEMCSDYCRVSYSLRPSPTGWIVIEWVGVGVD